MEELPMRHVTSVKLETHRNVVGGAFCAVVALACFAGHTGGVIIIGLLFIGLAILAFWGSPRVRLNTAGGDLRPARGAPWQRASAQAFVNAVRTALFAE